MAQHDYVIDNSTGANVRADINNVLQAIASNNSGSSDPSTTYAFQLFADTTNNVMKIRNAANNGFIELFQLDGTFTLEDGSASTPALAARNDLNTGVFFSAADTFDIATGGTLRLTVDSSGNLLNRGEYHLSDSGTIRGKILLNPSDTDDIIINAVSLGANIDFKTVDTQRVRIDSSGRLGIGTTSPTSLLNLSAASGNAELQLTRNNASANGNTYGNIKYTSETGVDVARIRSVRHSAANDAALLFETAASGTLSERIRMHTNGRVSIGTSSAQASLHIKSPDGSNTRLILEQTQDAANFQNGIDFKNAGTQYASISAGKDSSNNSFGIKFTTGASFTERMRINPSGFLKEKANCSSYVNASEDTHEFLNDSGNNVVMRLRHQSSLGFGIQSQLAHSSSSKYHFLAYDYVNDVQRCVIRSDGDLENSNNSYGQISDIKLKENVVDAKSQWDDIKALRVRNFNFKESTGHSTHKQLGLVAQEAELVCPNLVKETPDLEYDNQNKNLGTTTKSIKYSVLYMKAIKALQEAQARIETLETKVEALEAA